MGFIQKEDEFGNAPQDNNRGLVQYSAPSQAMREDGATQITRSGQPQDEEYLSERRFINITWRVIPSKIIQFFCSTLSFRSEIVRVCQLLAIRAAFLVLHGQFSAARPRNIRQSTLPPLLFQGHSRPFPGQRLHFPCVAASLFTRCYG